MNSPANPSAASTAPTISQIKDGMRTTWMAGDFGEVAKMIAAAGEAFVERQNIPQGTRVLDVACGTGNLTIPLARRGAVATGVDIAPNLVAQARERAAAEGVSATFDEGDAENLPYADASFEAVLTMFGAMFAPRPDLVAEEMARVLRPGGLLAMANWNAEGFTGKMFKTQAKHVPPPAGIVSPLLWGNEEVVRERLDPYFNEIECKIIPIDFDIAADPAGAVQFFRTYFGPTIMAFNRLDAAGQKALEEEFVTLWHAHNAAADPTKHTLVHNEYLQVTARRKLGPVLVR